METVKDDLIKRISTVLGDLNVEVSLEEYSTCPMPHGKTNKFFKVKDKDDTIYLIRINGELWPPHTRADESNNLEKLARKKIKTNVIHNGNDFQICYFKPEENRFSLITDENKKMECLENIAYSIKNYQEAVEFENISSSIRDMVTKAFNQQSVNNKKIQLNNYYEMIMKIIFVIEQDGKKKVSSHSDLLPSSIYYIDGEIIIVDWEYSGLNHPYYDLAHLSVLSSLTLKQDQAFLTNYDNSIKHFSIGQGHSFILMKAVISFILLLWNYNPDKEEQLSIRFLTSLQDAFGYALHENSMLSELASLLPLETIIPNLLESFIFQRSQVTDTTGSCLLESVQAIMNNGYFDANEVPKLRNKLLKYIEQQHPEDGFMINEKSAKEYCDSTAEPGDWPDALQFLSKIFSVKFYVYKLINGLIESQPLEFGDNLPYLHSCAYLVYNDCSQQYEPIFLFNSKDINTVVKTKFLINSRLNTLLEKFIYDENSSAFKISSQVLETNIEEHVTSITTMATDLDRGVSELRLYITQLREFRQKHNLPGLDNHHLLDQNISNDNVFKVFQNELNLLLLTTERFIYEKTMPIEEKRIAVTVEERHLMIPKSVSRAISIVSQISSDINSNLSPVISKVGINQDFSFAALNQNKDE